MELDGEKLRALVDKRVKYGKINTALFTVCALSTLVAATLAATRAQEVATFVLLAVACTLILLFATFNLFPVRSCSKKLKRALAEEVAQAFLDREELLRDKNTKLVVTYNEDTFGVDNGKESLKFNLAPLKKLVKIYSSFGVLVWDFLQGYYLLYPAAGVTVEDQTGGRARILELDGQVGPDRNYFIVQGILK